MNTMSLSVAHCCSYIYSSWLGLCVLSSLLGLCLPLQLEARSKSLVGKDCKVQNSLGNNEFNLNGLYNITSDYKIITKNNQTFYVNICGSLTKPCSNQQNVSVCLVYSDGKEIPIGYSNSSLIFDDGRLNFELNGDECKKGNKSKVIIIMKCDDAADINAGPEIWPSGGDCVFYFIWFNHLSCTPHTEIECSTIDNEGKIYNLNRLSLHSNNYIIHVKQNESRPFIKIELNVCHSVVFGHSAICAFNSGACAQDPSRPDTINLGYVSRGPYVKNGKLQLKYEQGDICREDGPAVNMSTIIEFACDYWKDESQPEFVSNHDCIYHFLWRTSAACPVDLAVSPQWGRDAADRVCTTSHRIITKHRFDLSFLMGKDYEVATNGWQTLLISICGPLKNNSCGLNAGSCLIESNSTQYLSLGRSSTTLQKNTQEAPFLEYMNGALCKDGQQWNTLITFVCRGEGAREGPHFIGISSCTYIVNWHTHVVCKRMIQCVANVGDSQVDLSPLVNEMDYQVTTDEELFHINVCQALRNPSGTNCPQGSGACVIDFSSSKNMSLGRPVNPPTLNEQGEAVIKYIDGSPCPNKPDVSLSSTIQFVCDKLAGNGNPSFVGIDNCEYHFQWRNSIVCGSEKEKFSLAVDDCFIRDYSTNITIDLKSLHKNGGHHVTGFTGKNYTINLCSSNDTCGGADICEEITFSATDRTTASYGQIFKVEYDFLNQYTKLFYSHGAPCVSTGKYDSTSEIWLKCEEGGSLGEPSVLSESDECHVLFEWRSGVACGTVTIGGSNDHIIPKRRQQASLAVRLAIGFGILLLVASCIVIVYCRKSEPCIRFKNRLSEMVGFRTQVVYSRQAADNDDWSEHCAMT